MSEASWRRHRASIVPAKANKYLINEPTSEYKSIRTAILVICTAVYLSFGAVVFQMLEEQYYNDVKKEMLILPMKIMKKYNITSEQYQELEATTENKPMRWTYARAFYFAFTVITTIGYGNIVPQTVSGKTLCMIYATFGIPLSIIMFQCIGERMNKLYEWTFFRIKKLSNKSHNLSYENEMPTHISILISSLFCVVVLFIGANFFSSYEEWPLNDGFYFTTMTLTSIGFGDLVALPDKNEYSITYLMYYGTFIFFGLTIFSSATNLLVCNAFTQQPSGHFADELKEFLYKRQKSFDCLKAESKCYEESSSDVYSCS